MSKAIAPPARLVPPAPLADVAPPSSRRLLWHYRNNALRAWPQAAYRDDVVVREHLGARASAGLLLREHVELALELAALGIGKAVLTLAG